MPRDYFDVTDGSIRANGCLCVCVCVCVWGPPTFNDWLAITEKTIPQRVFRWVGCVFVCGWRCTHTSQINNNKEKKKKRAGF
jgi:hypothetical protein